MMHDKFGFKRKVVGRKLAPHSRDYLRFDCIFTSCLKLTLISNISVLGVQQSATKSEIKAAYRELALEYHPDRKGLKIWPAY